MMIIPRIFEGNSYEIRTEKWDALDIRWERETMACHVFQGEYYFVNYFYSTSGTCATLDVQVLEILSCKSVRLDGGHL